MGKHSKRLSPEVTRTRIIRIAIAAALLGVGWTFVDRLPPTVSIAPAMDGSQATAELAPVSTSPVATPTIKVDIPDTGQKDGEIAPGIAQSDFVIHDSTPLSTTTKPPKTDPPKPTLVAVVPRAVTIPKAPAPAPKPPVAPPPKSDHSGLVAIARSFIGLGIPYVYGGKDPATGLDCSGFVWVVLKKAGYSVPYRSSSALKSWATPITAAAAKPGDLVFWPGHVGIYAGPGIVIDDGTSAGPKQTTIWGSPTYGRIPL